MARRYEKHGSVIGACFCGLVACTSSSDPATSGETDTPIGAPRAGAEAGASNPPHATGDAGSEASNDAPSSGDAGDSEEAKPPAQRRDDGNESSQGDGDASSVPRNDDDAGSRVDAGGQPAEPAQCNELVQLGSPVEAARTIEASVMTFDGGAVADGSYVLTQVTDFVGVPPGGTHSPYGTETLRIQGSTLEETFTYPSGDVRRFEATLTIDGTHLRLTPTCVWSSNPMKLPLLGDWAPTEHEWGATSFTASPATFTFLTPRGNHEAVMLVYTRLAD